MLRAQGVAGPATIKVTPLVAINIAMLVAEFLAEEVAKLATVEATHLATKPYALNNA